MCWPTLWHIPFTDIGFPVYLYVLIPILLGLLFCLFEIPIGPTNQCHKPEGTDRFPIHFLSISGSKICKLVGMLFPGIVHFVTFIGHDYLPAHDFELGFNDRAGCILSNCGEVRHDNMIHLLFIVRFLILIYLD